ncbi:hypothetical protein KI387_044407, partial [Taxus chinensis]
SRKPPTCKDIPRKGYVPNKSIITGALTRLAIEAAPATNSKCDVIEESDDEVEVVEVDEEELDSGTYELEVEDHEESNNHFFKYHLEEEDAYKEIVEDMNSQSFM